MMQAARTTRTLGAIGTERQREMALRIARGIWKRVPPHVPLADLEQVALTGLWEALERKGAAASMAYLIICVRGRVKDELRRQDWVPRYSRSNGLNWHVVHAADIDEGFEASLRSPVLAPEEAIDAQRALAQIADAPLGERDRHVLRLHYEGGHKFKDIADELGISEPRVSQIHHRAIGIVRAWLTGDLTEARVGSHYQVPLRLRKAIMEKHAQPEPEPGAPPQSFPSQVRAGRLGCAPAAPAVPAPPSAPPAPPPEPEPLTELAAVPSVLPDAGLDLRGELARYRDWLVGQALLRTGGHQRKAADLLGLREDVFSRLVKHGRGLVKPCLRRSKPAGARASSPAPQPRRRAEHGDSLSDVMSRLPLEEITRWHREGKGTAWMALKLSGRIGAGRMLVEMAVRRTVASLAHNGGV